MDKPNLTEERIGRNPAIAVSWCGEGELLVLLHGIGGNRTNWNAQMEAFGSFCRAVAWDARGYGASDDYEGETSIDIFAADLLAVVDHFGARRAHLCGLSLGGRIAQRFYARYPERLASLVLVDTRPDTADTRSPADREAFIALRAKPLLEGKTGADIAPSVAKSLAGPNVSPQAFDQLVASIAALHTQSYLKTIRANLSDDFASDLAAIRKPTLIVVGEHDTLTPPAIARGMAAAIEGSELKVIADSGHLSNIEQADAFNAAVVPFLRAQMQGAPRRPATD